MDPVRYTITPSHPQAHLFTVSCTLSRGAPDGQVFRLPVWTPGSYLVRDFSRHIHQIEAVSNGKAVAVEKLDKATWRCAPCDGPLTVTYPVYAWDESVRAAWLDTTRGFFNGTSVFLEPLGYERAPVEVDILRPEGGAYSDWRVATTLRPAGAAEWDFGRYSAEHYEDLIDHPVEMGRFDIIEFSASGIPHFMVLSGAHRADTERLASDLKRMCEEQIRLFGESVPMPRYLFLTRIVKKGYGGLEHRDSSALMCARDDLPLPGEARPSRGYRSFLGLCSHEYFHLWNVERIRPQAFLQNDLSREAYTEDLWAYEGVTSYYDELVLLRSGLIDLASYLELLSDGATRLWRTPGRARQSLSASSFDAWTKFYRPDENTPNVVVSYYNKGALVALCLDLKLRLETDGRCDLDKVMRALWERYGQNGAGVPERGLEQLTAEMSGLDLDEFFDSMVRGVEDPPLAELLSAFGIDGRLKPSPSGSEREGVNLGVRIVPGSTPPQVAHVLDGTPAQAAGLSAGDVLVAVDGLRVEGPDLDRMLLSYAPGDGIDIHVFRRDELMKFRAQLGAKPADTWTFRINNDAQPAEVARRKNWLRQS